MPDTKDMMIPRSMHDAKKLRDIAHLMRFLSANVFDLGLRGSLEAAEHTLHNRRAQDIIGAALKHPGREVEALSAIIESDRWPAFGTDSVNSDASILMEIAVDLERAARNDRKRIALYSPYYHREMEHETERIERTLDFSSLDEGTQALIMDSVDRIAEIVRADTEEYFRD